MEAIRNRYITIQLDYSPQAGATPISKFITCDASIVGTPYDYLSCDISIERYYGWDSDVASVRIKGLAPDIIESLTYANLNYNYDINDTNIITIYAGYELSSDGVLPPCIYRGFIRQAYPDYNSSRDRPFIIKSIQGWGIQNKVQKSITSKEVKPLDDIFKTIVTNMGLDYEGQNIQGKVNKVNYDGSGITQLRMACRDYGYKYHYIYATGANRDKIIVTPLSVPSNSETITINKNNGMIGFPEVYWSGVNIKTYFDNKYQMGSPVLIESLTVPYINSLPLYINGLTYELSNKTSAFWANLQLNTYRASAVF